MSLDPFDYKEPACPLGGGKEFYDFESNRQEGSIPIRNVIEKLDGYLNREDYVGADRLLKYWLEEARSLKDRKGELSILSEIMGFSRRIKDADGGLAAVWRGFELVEELPLDDKTAGTILLNGATTLKAFGKAKEAVRYYEKARDCYGNILADYDPLWGGFYNNYALALSDLERYDEALDHYQNAIDIMAQKEYGGLEIAVTLMNVAELFERMGENDALIEQSLEQAFAYLDDPQLPQNGYYAFVCRKCAPTFGHFGWFMTEKDLNERANRIYEGS